MNEHQRKRLDYVAYGRAMRSANPVLTYHTLRVRYEKKYAERGTPKARVK